MKNRRFDLEYVGNCPSCGAYMYMDNSVEVTNMLDVAYKNGLASITGNYSQLDSAQSKCVTGNGLVRTCLCYQKTLLEIEKLHRENTLGRDCGWPAP